MIASERPLRGEPARCSRERRRADLRRDDLTGSLTYVVDSRQSRPNLPEATCPFCPGGLEAPEPYDVRWFENRWPAMPDDRCEVVLYTPEHDATFWSLGAAGARKVIDLWAERSAALGARADIDVRARLREPRRRGRRDDHAPARPDLRVRLRARAAAAASSTAAARSATPATGSSPRSRTGGPGCPRRRSSRTRCAWLPTSRCPTCRRSTTPVATRSPRSSSTCSSASTASSTPRRRTCSGSTSGRSTAATGPARACTSRSSRRGAPPACTRYIAAGELGSGVYFNPVAPEAAAAGAPRRARPGELSGAASALERAALPRRQRELGAARACRA